MPKFYNGGNKLEKDKEMNFEETMKELEQIAQELEKGEFDLDTSVKKFEKGMELSKAASSMLDKAEKRINILISQDGNITEENFEN